MATKILAKKQLREQSKQQQKPKRITKPALQRILRVAGIKRINSNIYDRLREILFQFVNEIVTSTLIFTEYEERKTVKVEDLSSALENKGLYLGAGLNENAKITASLRSCNSRGMSSEGKKDAGEKKTRRFHPGIVALRSIKFRQKHSDSLAIPSANFFHVVRDIASKQVQWHVRYAKGVIPLFQLAVERHLVDICRFANMIALHSSRETVYPKDVDLVLQIKTS